jgi:hypothetical protein
MCDGMGWDGSTNRSELFVMEVTLKQPRYVHDNFCLDRFVYPQVIDLKNKSLHATQELSGAEHGRPMLNLP